MAGRDRVKKAAAWALIVILLFFPGKGMASDNEVLGEGNAKVFIRQHPQTGKDFVSLRTASDAKDLFKGFVKREVRPDYKMLDADAKGVPYDGPVSDRTKVYVFAATLITLGAAGAVVTAAIPAGAAAAGAGSGGAGLLGAGTLAVVGGTAGEIALKSHLAPGEENYVHDAKAVSASGAPEAIGFQEALRRADAEPSSA